MKHDINMSKTTNLTFKLVILYSNMHMYKVDRMENHYIQYFDSMTHPQTPQETQSWVPKRNNGKRRELRHASNLQHFRGRKVF
jgi:hypothetical protein